MYCCYMFLFVSWFVAISQSGKYYFPIEMHSKSPINSMKAVFTATSKPHQPPQHYHLRQNSLMLHWNVAALEKRITQFHKVFDQTKGNKAISTGILCYRNHEIRSYSFLVGGMKITDHFTIIWVSWWNVTPIAESIIPNPKLRCICCKYQYFEEVVWEWE